MAPRPLFTGAQWRSLEDAAIGMDLNSGYLRVFRDQLAKEIERTFQNSVSNLQRDIAGVGVNIAQVIKEYGVAANSPADKRNINANMARRMQGAVVGAYKANVLAEKRVPSYRQGDRYSGGKLLRALSSPGMVIGTAEGIGFINVGMLDQAAKQWKRLNFGALPGVGQTGPEWSQPSALAKWGNATFDFGLHEPMSGPFNLPVGWFQSVQARGAGGRLTSEMTPGAFYAVTADRKLDPWLRKQGRFNIRFNKEKKQTQGIAPRYFLDHGVSFLAKNYGRDLERHFRQTAERITLRHQQQHIRRGK